MVATGYIARYVDQVLDELMQELPALMLTGPRGCGKTTTAARRARSTISLDRVDQAAAFEADPDALLASRRTPILIDEWQAVPQSLSAVKRAVDQAGKPGQFIITGSVRASHLAQGWPATGRVVPLPMYGLTMGEIPAHSDNPLTMSQLFGPWDPRAGVGSATATLPSYVDAAVRGGFPDCIDLSDRGRAAWYAEYVDQLIHRDLPELGTQVRSPTAMGVLLRAVAHSTAGTPTLASLAAAAGINHRTAQSYLERLEDLRVVERLPAWSSNRLKRLVKSPKYYIVDPGLAAHLAGVDRAGILSSGDLLGRHINTFVAAQLRPLAALAFPRVSLFHLRDTNGDHEVDLVLEASDGRLVGIEVKASSTVTARDARHLCWLRDELGPEFHRGLVLHTGQYTFQLDDHVWAIPISRLWDCGGNDQPKRPEM